MKYQRWKKFARKVECHLSVLSRIEVKEGGNKTSNLVQNRHAKWLRSQRERERESTGKCLATGGGRCEGELMGGSGT